MFAIVCAFLASCDSEGGDLNRTPLLKVVGPDGSDPSQPISIDGKSQEVAFTVLATADWTADIAGDEGFALSDRSGATGNTKVTVVAARNLSGATRSATVSFRLGGEERYAYTISQTEEQPYLDVDPRRSRSSATIRSSPSPSRPTRARGRSRSTAPTATAGSPSSPKRAPRSPSWPKRTRRARTARRRSNSSRSFTPKSSTTSQSRRGTWFRPRRPTCSTWSSPKTAPRRMSRPWA